jgi:hypothetical protein
MNCRHPIEHVFLDLGIAPPSNACLRLAGLNKIESYCPLKLYVCEYCWLVQTEADAQADEMVTQGYAYFSSVPQGLDMVAIGVQQSQKSESVGEWA